MTSATAVKGIKISDIKLMFNPRVRWSNTNPKFRVHIRFNDGEESETIVATEKNCLARSNEKQVIWNETFSFAGQITDSVVTFKVYKFQLLSKLLVGKLVKKVNDLLQPENDSETCVLDLNNESQLSFQIELQPAVLQDIIFDASRSSARVPTGESPKIAKIMSSAYDTFVNQENIWSQFLSQFRIFMNVVEKIAEIHPYLQLAWSVLSVIPGIVIASKTRNDSVKQLCEKLVEVYNFITDAERLPQLDKTPINVLSLLVRQTIECAYFIREYSKENSAERIWKGSINDDKIKGFIDKFDHFEKVITDFVTLDTGIITLRVSKTVNEIWNSHLLDDMSYARDAGFISKKRCLPGTRRTLIEEILQWVNSDESERILVLSGQAGTGKSAIAHTIAEIFQKQNRLGSLFCFNRIYRDRINQLFTTITRDLADGDVSWRQSLIGILEKTAIRRSNDPVTQFGELIVKPSKEISTIGPVVIVIDALDESGDWRERQPLLDILFGQQLSSLPTNYRFILTTRPEQDIELHCKSPSVLRRRMGDISEKETFSDIQSYVSSRLKPISKILDEIKKDWSWVLAKRAEGFFQWAETACRVMDSLYHPPSLKKAWDACTFGSSTSLYDLYHTIISNQRECEYPEFIEDFKLIIGAIITAREPLTIQALGNIFQDIHVQVVLYPFGSLLVGVHDEVTPVRPLHTSLLDFFHAKNRDPTNRNEFYVDTSDQSVFALGCLKLMNRTLRFNPCNLETSHLRNRDIPNFVKRVERAIPLHLSYTSRFWAFHLRDSVERTDLILVQLRTLMENKILFWFEVLGLLRKMEEGRVGMRIMQDWCKGKDSELVDQATDAWRFGFDFGDAIDESTPHLYLSALPFTPGDSFISKQFLSMYPQLFNIEVGRQQVDSAPRTGIMKKNSSAVLSLAFSPQGKYIASGFENGEVWFWDYESGEILSQWRARENEPWNSVLSIVFSADGHLVYCCYMNGSICILDVETKEIISDSHYDILEGDCFWCTVSSDGCYLAFVKSHGLYERLLLLCDRKSRRKLMQIACSHYPVFSPNGDMLAFLNQSCKLHLWNIRQQTLVHCWEECDTLALSNKHIAFRAYFAIDVWDIHTFTRVREFQTTSRGSLRFAGDQHLLFHSENAYTIWDVSTGELIVESSLGGDNTYFMTAVSPDLKYVALTTWYDVMNLYVGPLDIPIQMSQRKASNIPYGSQLTGLWLRGRYLVQLYHLESVYTFLVSDTSMAVNSPVFQVSSTRVAVSPRNEHVSVAYDTDRGLFIWNDIEKETILDNSAGDLTTLEFSPLGNHLISRGRDGVKIWDIDTRVLIGGPYPVPGDLYALTLSATGENFIVVYETPGAETIFIEVRECQSGLVINGPFKSGRPPPRSPHPSYDMGTLSANETRIMWTSESGIVILDALTGKSEIFNPYTDDEDLPSYELSPNQKYVAWYLEDPARVELWDIDNRILLQELPFNYDQRMLFFSDDSTKIIICYFLEDNYYADVWEISTGGAVRKAVRTRLPSIAAPRLLSLSGDRLVFSGWNIARSLNLDVYRFMSFLCEQHKSHSQFGMFPVDDFDTRQRIQILRSRLKSNGEDILDYALTAWDKALFSMDAEMTLDGWILGPHGELLFWVPEKRRGTLWRPCMAHISGEHFTKLNFDRFVHGSQWLECKGNL